MDIRRKVTAFWQVGLFLAVMGVACPLASAQLNSFTAQGVVDPKLNATAVAGAFSPTSSISLSTQTVTVSLAGTNSFGWTFSAGSFKKTRLGGYVATAESGSTKVGVLLQPLKEGKWAYSAAVEGYTPGSTTVTVSVTIGSQSGSKTVTPYVF